MIKNLPEILEIKNLYESYINATIPSVAGELLKMTKRQVKLLHEKTYSIHQRSGKKAGWYTVRPDDGKRIERKTEDELLEALLAIYLNLGYRSRNMTLEDLFPEWLDYKSSITESPNTITAHEKHWCRFFEGTELFQKPLRSITVIDLNVWANKLVREHNLSRHDWQTIKTIPKQMFEYALIKGYIDKNPFLQMKITVKYRQINKKSGNTQTFTTEEYAALISDIWKSYNEKHDVRFLAVLSNFCMALRCGELSALQWCDIQDGEIHVCREIVLIQSSKLISETYKKSLENGEITVFPGQENKKWVYAQLNHTKTHSDRIIPITPELQYILDMVPHSCEYVFADEHGMPITLRSINSVLEYACDHIGIPRKRSHKIRKTVASQLYNAGIAMDRIREFLGHMSLSTTEGYIYDTKTADENLSLMSKAMSGIVQDRVEKVSKTTKIGA